MTLILIGIFVFAGLSWAEFFRYIDKDGNVRFTDDYSQVPPDQRKKGSGVRTYDGYQSTEEIPPSTPTRESSGAKTNTAEPSTAEESTGEIKPDKETGKRLDSRRQELEAEYQRLQEEYQRLQSAKENAETDEEIQQINDEILEYSRKHNEYLKKRQEFNEQVKTFNDALEKVKQQQSEQ